MWVKKDANGDYSEQILSESNTGVLKACQKETGNVGFSREDMTIHLIINYLKVNG